MITIAVTVFLVVVIGGAVALQLAVNPAPAPTPPARPPALATVPSSTQSIKRMAVGEAKQLADAGQAVLVDTRSAQSYQSEHAVGAISFPEGDEDASFGRLPTDKILVFYCT